MYPVFGEKREQCKELVINRYRYTAESNKASQFHFHSLIEIMQVYDGQIEALIGEKRTVLNAGEIAVALSYEPHSFRSVGKAEAVFMFVPTRLCEDFILLTRNKRVSLPFVYDKKAAEIISSLISELSKSDINRIEQKGYIYTVLGTVMRYIDFNESAEPKDAALTSKLLSYVNDNYKNNISLSSVSSVLGYNSEYISKYFRTCFHMPINKYITTLRLKNAVMLIEEQTRSITEAALESGFSSIRTFYRAFETEFGCSPREYLKSIN